MHRRLIVLTLAAVGLAACADETTTKQADLDRQLRALEKEIEKVRELKFVSPVVAHVIPRPKTGAEGIQGYYDTKKKAVYLYDDLKGNYSKGTLIHEMVHALQDQHFGLARQDDAPLTSDAELARAALIEGDATYTMIEVLEKEQPHVRKMLSTSLDKARNLRNAFLYGLGAKYVQRLKEKDGWKAVNDRYLSPPTSTAAVLHPDERVTPLNLGAGTTVGEYGVIKLLGAHPASQANAVQAAAGWRGDKRSKHGEASSWVVAFDKPEQAARFFRSISDLRAAEHPVGKQQTKTDQAHVWTCDKGRHHGVLVRDRRVYDLSAPDATAYAGLVERIDGPPKLAVYSARDKKVVSFGEFTDRLMEADFVCVGETHDSEVHHAVQLMVIKALYARDERLGVGMEMFQRPFQASIDRYIDGAIPEETFLRDTEYSKRWGFAWELYRPIVDFCRRNRVPLAGLNIGDELRRRLSRGGYDKLSAEDKAALGPIDFTVKEHRAHWFDQLGTMHGHGKMSNDGKERMYQVMTAWDEYMADSAARFLKDRKLRRVVILAGSGHIDHGFGIPQRAAKRAGGKSMTVHVRLGGDLAKVGEKPVADFVVVVQ